MDRLKFGVIGTRFGQFLVRTLAHLEGAQLVAIADRNPNIGEGLDTYATRYGANAYHSSEAMFANEALDAVVVATAPKARTTIIEAAAARGIAMFVEKPWAANPSHAAQLADICRRHDARVMLGFSFRFHPAIVRLRELMDGELGEGWVLNGEYVFDYCRRKTTGSGIRKTATGCSTRTPAIFLMRSVTSWAGRFPCWRKQRNLLAGRRKKQRQ